MTPLPLLGMAAVVVAVVLTSCGGSADDTSNPSTNRIAEPGEVANLEDGTQVVTQGMLVAEEEARLCEILAESFPPQCAGDSVVLSDLDLDDVVAMQTLVDAQATPISWTTYPLAVIGTVEGGELVNTELAGNVYETVSNGLRVRLTPAQTPFFPRQLRSGEEVWWAIDATNLTDVSVPLTFGSGQRAEVTISDGDTELYRWSDGKAFTQEVLEVVLGAGEVGASTLSDVLVTPAGTNYMLRGWITGVGVDEVVVTAPIEVIEN